MRSKPYLINLIPTLLLAGVFGCSEQVGTHAQDSPPSQPSNGGTGYGIIYSVDVDASPMNEGDSGDSLLNVTIRLVPRSAGVVNVDYLTQDQSATAGEDYRRAKGRVTFLPGDTQKTVQIAVIGDTDDEDDETMELKVAYSIGGSDNLDTHVLTILDDDDPESGLASRPQNLTCVAPDRPTSSASIAIEPAFSQLPSFSQPLALLQAPNSTDSWYVVEKDGKVFKFDNDPLVSSASPFVDISGGGTAIDVDSAYGESGLLGMAFHPDYGTSNYSVFLSYTVDGSPLVSVVARFESLDNGATLDADEPADAEVLLAKAQPAVNHNGGNIAFGPDGYFYVGFGDGGPGGDPNDRAQDTNSLYGALLRIDVDNGVPYGIPSDNPYAPNARCEDGTGSEPCPEIYAWGFRNPWRWNFDDATGLLWLGDVGQSSWEEIDIVELGGNYGWRCREGAHDFDTSGVCPSGLIDPVIEYPRNVGRSITGGFVYRGSAIPELIGRYVFADYVEGKIFASTTDGQGNYGYELLLNTNHFIASFAEDENGELYYLNYAAGDIHKIVQGTGTTNNTIPDLLSDTGCVDALDPTQPAAGVIPYDINAPFWSDGAAKQRFYAIPDNTTIDVGTDGDWLFPDGTVLMKHFRLNDELFETRLFMRHTDGSWAGYTYEWNVGGTDAIRVIGGKGKDVQGQSWTYPSESECMSCHTQTANFSLGIEHGQLNKDFNYPSTGVTANQLTTADAVDLLAEPLADTPENLPKFADPVDTGAGLAARARAYLHSNCSGCHRPLGPTPSNMDLREDTDLSASNTCNAEPSGDTLGIPGAKIVVPGDASASLLVQRPNRRDALGMPPLASNAVDSVGVQLLSDWVNSLSACP